MVNDVEESIACFDAMPETKQIVLLKNLILQIEIQTGPHQIA